MFDYIWVAITGSYKPGDVPVEHWERSRRMGLSLDPTSNPEVTITTVANGIITDESTMRVDVSSWQDDTTSQLNQTVARLNTEPGHEPQPSLVAHENDPVYIRNHIASLAATHPVLMTQDTYLRWFRLVKCWAPVAADDPNANGIPVFVLPNSISVDPPIVPLGQPHNGQTNGAVAPWYLAALMVLYADHLHPNGDHPTFTGTSGHSDANTFLRALTRREAPIVAEPLFPPTSRITIRHPITTIPDGATVRLEGRFHPLFNLPQWAATHAITFVNNQTPNEWILSGVTGRGSNPPWQLQWAAYPAAPLPTQTPPVITPPPVPPDGYYGDDEPPEPMEEYYPYLPKGETDPFIMHAINGTRPLPPPGRTLYAGRTVTITDLPDRIAKASLTPAHETAIVRASKAGDRINPAVLKQHFPSAIFTRPPHHN